MLDFLFKKSKQINEEINLENELRGFEYLDSKEKFDNWMQNAKPLEFNGLSEDELRANLYTINKIYTKLNGQLFDISKGEPVLGLDSIANQVKVFDEMIYQKSNEMEGNIIVYRGVSNLNRETQLVEDRKIFEKDSMNQYNGDEKLIAFDGYSYTGMEQIEQTLNNVKMHILIPEGSNYLFTSYFSNTADSYLSKSDVEIKNEINYEEIPLKEVVLPRNSVFEVLKEDWENKEKTQGTIYLKLRNDLVLEDKLCNGFEDLGRNDLSEIIKEVNPSIYTENNYDLDL